MPSALKLPILVAVQSESRTHVINSEKCFIQKHLFAFSILYVARPLVSITFVLENMKGSFPNHDRQH